MLDYKELCDFFIWKRNARTVVRLVATNLGWILQVNGSYIHFIAHPVLIRTGPQSSSALKDPVRVSCNPAHEQKALSIAGHTKTARRTEAEENYAMGHGHACNNVELNGRDRCIVQYWSETPALTFSNR